MSFTAIYLHFFAGPFLKETRPGKDVDFFTTWATCKSCKAGPPHPSRQPIAVRVMEEEAKDDLRAAVPGGDRQRAAVNTGNLPYLQRHHKVGKFGLRPVIDIWTEKLVQALASGYVRKADAI